MKRFLNSALLLLLLVSMSAQSGCKHEENSEEVEEQPATSTEAPSATGSMAMSHTESAMATDGWAMGTEGGAAMGTDSFGPNGEAVPVGEPKNGTETLSH